jgi:uncharacterized protein DUF1566
MKKLLFLVVCLALTACAQKHSFMLLEQTAIDQGTGLVWTKSANPAGKPLHWRGDDNVYAFILKLNNETYAGYADWRVPTREEMSSLIAYAKSLGYDSARYETWPYQKLRQLGFSDVRDYDYWTATRNSPEELWIADLASGRIEPKPDAKPYYLWPVRGGAKR